MAFLLPHSKFRSMLHVRSFDPVRRSVTSRTRSFVGSLSIKTLLYARVSIINQCTSRRRARAKICNSYSLRDVRAFDSHNQLRSSHIQEYITGLIPAPRLPFSARFRMRTREHCATMATQLPSILVKCEKSERGRVGEKEKER